MKILFSAESTCRGNSQGIGFTCVQCCLIQIKWKEKNTTPLEQIQNPVGKSQCMVSYLKLIGLRCSRDKSTCASPQHDKMSLDMNLAAEKIKTKIPHRQNNEKYFSIVYDIIHSWARLSVDFNIYTVINEMTMISCYVTDARRVSLVEQELLFLPEHLILPRFLVGFVLLDL